MLSEFLQNFSGKLAERWAANLLTPAFLFWAGGAAAWIWRHQRMARASTLASLSTPAMLPILVGGLLLVLFSTVVAQRLQPWTLRLLEGYWHPALGPLRRRMAARQSRKLGVLEERFQQLASAQDQGTLTAAQSEEYVKLDCRLRRAPAQADKRMPTRLGNILRAAESSPSDKYGLDTVVCWPRLWLLLPDGAKKDLSEARSALGVAAASWLWSVLFLVWTVWAWWAAPVGILLATACYSWMLAAAENFGDLLESAFDVYRAELYKMLRWRLPSTAADERESGRELTQYLWRGDDGESILFAESGK
jgi:hypothetical protein